MFHVAVAGVLVEHEEVSSCGLRGDAQFSMARRVSGSREKRFPGIANHGNLYFQSYQHGSSSV